MESIYVWMNLRSIDGRGGESSRIIFIGKEKDCIEFVKSVKWTTIKNEFKKSYMTFWSMLKPERMECRISAGSIERKFLVNIK